MSRNKIWLIAPSKIKWFYAYVFCIPNFNGDEDIFHKKLHSLNWVIKSIEYSFSLYTIDFIKIVYKHFRLIGKHRQLLLVCWLKETIVGVKNTFNRSLNLMFLFAIYFIRTHKFCNKFVKYIFRKIVLLFLLKKNIKTILMHMYN